MITGAQIHEARKLLGWSRDRLAPKAGMCTNIFASWRSGRSRFPTLRPPLCPALSREAGVEFTNGDEAGVKLKVTKVGAGLR